MAAGDVKTAAVTVPGTNGTVNIQPPSGEEWVIHNLSYTAPGGTNVLEVYFTDGTNSTLLDSDTTAGSMQNRFWHLTNSLYLRLKNAGTDATSITAIYNGVQTK